MSLARKVAQAAWDTSPDTIDSWWLTHSPRKEQELEAWGEALIERLRTQGIYINQARGDVSGRW